MIIEITDEMRKTPNDWVALNPKTYELIDRDESLVALMERTGKDVLFTKNWLRPQKI